MRTSRNSWRLLVALIVLVATIASGSTLVGAETAVAANNIETATTVEADANIPAGHVGSESVVFDDWVSGCCVAPNTTPGGGKPFAMGIEDHLDEFANRHGATTWKQLDDPSNWKSGVFEKLSDPDQRVIFNLDGVDVQQGLARAAAGGGGATDWELLTIKQIDFPNLEFWQAGQKVEKPF